MQLSEEQIETMVKVRMGNCTSGLKADAIALVEDVLALRAQADARPIGKVLSEEEMGIGYDRRTGPVLWFGTPKPGLIYTHPEVSAGLRVFFNKEELDALYEAIEWAKDEGLPGTAEHLQAIFDAHDPEASAPGLSAGDMYDLMVEHCDGNGFQVEPEVIDSIANHIASTATWQGKNEAAAESLTRASAATVAEPSEQSLMFCATMHRSLMDVLGAYASG